jgi:hypothetical protein
MNLIIALGVLIMGIGVISIIVILIKLGYNKLFNPKSQLAPIDRFFNEDQKSFLTEIRRMHDDNEAKMLFQGDQEIFEKVTASKLEGEKNYLELLGLKDWEDADPKSDLHVCGNFVSELMLDLNRRFIYEKIKIDPLNDDEVLRVHKINIKDNEVLLYKISNSVDLFEEKERIKSITYSGISTNFRSGGMNYRFGNIKPFPNRESYWDNFDRCGLFMLNNKMVFVGSKNKKNTVIKYDDILTGELFSNGIILSLANSKKILIDFPEYKDSVVKRDDRNIFTRVLQRVLENNTDQNLV